MRSISLPISTKLTEVRFENTKRTVHLEYVNNQYLSFSVIYTRRHSSVEMQLKLFESQLNRYKAIRRALHTTMDMQITTANYETKYQQLINVVRNALNVREPINYLTVVADYITEVLFM